MWKVIRKGNTKQRIIEESMKLFSVHGFEEGMYYHVRVSDTG